MKVQPDDPSKDNKYKMPPGGLTILIDELEQFIDSWYMVPTTVKKSLQEAHINACRTMWPNGKIPAHITDYRDE